MNALDRLVTSTRQRMRLDIQGNVQGVGFRPFAYQQAHRFSLSGWVINTPAGVTVEVEGPSDSIDRFTRALRDQLPAPGRVDRLDQRSVPLTGGDTFAIQESEIGGARSAMVLPDIAVCDDCLAEVNDPRNRRYRYPFTNCTHCGPRYSIIDDLPYDRARTSMRNFVMCADCRREYDDPGDRRFHAEPNVCPECGPSLALWDSAGTVLATRDEALLQAASAIRRGEIAAVKGLGGFHLIVDARNQVALERLRKRKQRPDKPFAVMFRSMAEIDAAAQVDAVEADLLTSVERPIVLLRGKPGALADAVAPGCALVGAMLPYTPLHHLLLSELDGPVVATSGNRSDEPIVTDEAEAISRLAGIADLFLVHDRPIVRPVDDSVVRMIEGRPMIMRRARGFAPAVIAAPVEPGTLALGGHLKSAIALTTSAGIVVGQHIGDLDTVEARGAFDRAVGDLTRLHDVDPLRVACDLHPDYHATRAAAAFDVPIVRVQHHLAHVAACMAEHGLKPPLLGVSWDGTGYGGDGTIWGGEFLHIEEDGWSRVAHLRPFRLPGGDVAVREPRRSAFGLLHALLGNAVCDRHDLASVAAFDESERGTLATMIGRNVNAPMTTSAGRLFDAVASLIGLVQRTTYEGQAAAMLEWAATEGCEEAYSFPLREGDGPIIVDWEPAVRAILADLAAGARGDCIAAAFHTGLACAIADVAMRIGDRRVVLTGGCFQNRRLAEGAIAAIRSAGLVPVWPERVPPNDGGLALGQAYWAARSEGGA